jgi:pimeloyl-ACP methyl ester carboxylesterase
MLALAPGCARSATGFRRICAAPPRAGFPRGHPGHAPAHGRRLAALIPRARYAEIPGAYVLSMLDEPAAVAREVSAFLTSTPAANEPGQDQDRP